MQMLLQTLETVATFSGMKSLFEVYCFSFLRTDSEMRSLSYSCNRLKKFTSPNNCFAEDQSALEVMIE